MIRRRIDPGRDRRVVIGLVTSTPFLAQAVPLLRDDPDVFEAAHLRTVAGWCADYHEQYARAPGRHVQDLFRAWAETCGDEQQVAAVKDILESLGEQFDTTPLKGGEISDGTPLKGGSDINVPYLLDELRAVATRRRLLRAKDAMEVAISAGRLADAEEALAEYRQVRGSESLGSKPLNLRDPVWERTHADPAEPLFTFEGDAGKFLNPALVRDGLVGIQAPEKTGKTFWCVELAVRALRQRRRVALFEVGDLTESQIHTRIAVRISGLPARAERWISTPVKIDLDDAADAGYAVELRRTANRGRLTLASTRDAIRRFRRAAGMRLGEDYAMTSVHPTRSANVSRISSILDIWEQEHGFVADVVVVDYADILAPERELRDARHQVDETWAALRRLSQERHALVVVPTQANSETYRHAAGRLQTMANFSEDKRKLAHVTAMLALNQSPAEAQMQGMRLNWVVAREFAAYPGRPLYVGTCFALARPICCALLPRGKRRSTTVVL